MANNLKISTASRNAAMDAVTALIDGGTAGVLEIYDGAQPAGPDTAITTQNLLVSLTFSATSFGASVAGVATADTITNGTATGTGDAAWFRIKTQTGGTAVIDGTVGTSGCDLNLDSTSITSGQTVSCSAFTLTHPA